MQSRVLIVDDDADMREALELVVLAGGHECEVASNAIAALKIVERDNVDVVICDVVMDGMSGLDLLDRVKRTHPAVPFIVITGAGGIPQAVSAIKRGAFEYVVKPCGADAIRAMVANALARKNVGDSLPPTAPQSSRRRSDELVGDSAAMRLLQTAIEFVARSSAPVLITGETGTGKDVVAHAIHDQSARRNQPYVALNMSAIPADLMEGEIFGHVRGAFTGASQARKGLFTEANGGTLLLDEIGDMPFALQAKLLRVLQFGEVRPVGSERTHLVDVRVIAATHQDLAVLVKEGRFRPDLYFRLNVLPIAVPPLRQHREDIPALVTHFLTQSCERAPLSPVRSVTSEALQALVSAPWPGNVRELASVIERAVVFGTNDTLDVGQIISSGNDEPPMSNAHPWPPAAAPWTLRKLSRAYTDWVLEGAGGNKERAAEILGIDLSTLYRWQRARVDSD